MYSFPQVRRFLTFSKKVAPVSEFSESFFPVWSSDESNTRVTLKYDTPEHQETSVNWEEVSSTVYTLEDHLKWIFAFYTVIREKDVRRFLESNEFLIPPVFTTFLTIKKYFSYSKVTLDVETDYEYPSHQELAAHVVTNIPLEGAFRQLKQFDDHWLEVMPKQAMLKFYVDLRFE
jgi:hypothetical protein